MTPPLFTFHLFVANTLRAKAATGWQLLSANGVLPRLLLLLFQPLQGVHATEVFNGVAIEFGQTFLHEKRAMQLHAVLSAEETQLVANAMERIAATINEAHAATDQERTAWRKNTQAQKLALRNVLRASGVDPHLGMAVKQIHHWKISGHRMVFDADYYMPSRVGQPPEIYRDRYAISLSDAGWYFSGHPMSMPIGRIRCQFVNALWVCPETP